MTGVLAWVGVAVFGAVGALLRFEVSSAITKRHPSRFPYGTFAVNITGAFLLGLLTGAELSGKPLLVFGTGLLGAYTTFSTWMVEAERLAEAREWLHLILYLAGSMLAGLAAAGLGWILGGAFA
ncbi:MAG TPA: fluoride efflux transporter CrcB [Solirubrobacter sp.]|nr:fluoride efflux transporter CrcB [Solirubrobacter sp.]